MQRDREYEPDILKAAKLITELTAVLQQKFSQSLLSIVLFVCLPTKASCEPLPSRRRAGWAVLPRKRPRVTRTAPLKPPSMMVTKVRLVNHLW